jgi:nicotinamide riboside kinase
MYKIIVTGPESSGKTTLSKNLSQHLNSKLVNEFARYYLQKNNNKYNFESLLEIAQNQLKLENQKSQIIICDTDLITIKIWSEYKFGKCDSWILDKINTQKKEQRIYLLCKPDINWEYDPQRENELDRDKLFNIYKKELISLEHKFWIIKGNNRLDLAKKYIASIF